MKEGYKISRLYALYILPGSGVRALFVANMALFMSQKSFKNVVWYDPGPAG